nr:RNA-dependent RNA polymerase 6 [Ipomoea batatas]
MGSDWSDEDMSMIVTQISVGGFGNDVNAKLLSDYFDEEVGHIWRCRLKTSSTPFDTYPNYEVDHQNVRRMNDYEKVVPHAFVHFVMPSSAISALAAAGRNELVLAGNPLKVSLGPKNPHRMNETRRTVMPLRLEHVRVEMGVMASHGDFVVCWRGPPKGVDFLVDPFNATCRLLFTKDIAFNTPREAKHAVIKCDFKIEFTLKEINKIERYDDLFSLVILLQLASSPLVYYRTADDDIEDLVPFELLDDDDPWIRTTDFTPSMAIGRCNTYRISIPPRKGPTFNKAVEYFGKQRVRIDHPKHKLRVRDKCDFKAPIPCPFFCIQNEEGLSFPVLFLLNAVLHKGIFNQHQMTDEFFKLLRNQPENVNLAALKHICAYKWPVYEASRELMFVQKWLLNNPKLIEGRKELDDIAEVRRLIITPTKAYCLPPEVELSNRVLRKYRDISDRFLRVTFMDEGMRTLNRNVLSFYPAPIVKDITKSSIPQKTVVFMRVKNILKSGFTLCGRQYSFLAFSPNQLRDRSAWFFADGPDIRVPNIKTWMGRFTNKNVAKCAARMGLCFSSTYATFHVRPSEIDGKLPEIERNGYVFSDGIGIISPDLAAKVAEKLQLSVNPPCAYQIRYSGFKGVVACWPGRKDRVHLYLRPSMKKFESTHTVLEICSWTRFQPGFLNRQIVTLLSALAVEDQIFWKMQETMISRLNQMVVDADVAFDILTASCAEQGNTAAIMLSAGFKPQTEPHLQGMLTSIRAAQLSDLRERARIFVPSGRWLMGCLDELGELEQGQCFIQVSSASLENCFVKHGSKFEARKNLKVIQGLVVIAKNPCLHPGDVRILEAVDIPSLHHLYDCLVFPQKGSRPHTNEASGSDLDGDLYFVTWDEDLIPPSKQSWEPMEYAAAEVRELPRDVNQSDIIEFFAKNMVNESLGAICNAHVVHADLSEHGALDDKCLKLAELAAIAVDFPKTGKIVNMPNDLKPKMYPDFMGKEEFQTYKSKKILGKLYRRITDGYDEENEGPSGPMCLPEDAYDPDLEIPGSETFFEDAWSCKCSYDGQVNSLLGQYKVNREDEVVTGHIWSMPKHSSNKIVDLKERLKHAYNNLRKDFRKVFDQFPPDVNQLSDDERNAFYERKASAWYQVTYHRDWVSKSQELQHPNGAGGSVMLSFPWIAADYLAMIKLRCRGMGNADSSKPINALRKYLVDRM